MASWDFPGSDPIDVNINLPSGSIAIAAEPTEATKVSLLPSRPGRDSDELIEQVSVEFADGKLEIMGPKNLGLLRHRSGLDLTVKVPTGSRCTVHTASSDIACVGELGSLEAHTASGDVTAGVVRGPVELAAASGDVWLEEGSQGVNVHSASGDVSVLRASGDISIDTASGDIQIGTADGAVTARTASGDVRMECFGNGVADVNTVSGDVTVGVAAGIGVYLDLSSFTGDIRSDLDPSDNDSDDDGDADVTVKCKTVSGDVRVRKGEPAGSADHPKIKFRWK
jgi:DUF4097 and DUF4098 domain-containing protein YvlB